MGARADACRDAMLRSLAGWEIRDTCGLEPCSIERSTDERGDFETLAEGLTQAEANVIEAALYMAFVALGGQP